MWLPLIRTLHDQNRSILSWQIWEGGDSRYLADQLAFAVSEALSEGPEAMLEVGFEGIATSFPVIQ